MTTSDSPPPPTTAAPARALALRTAAVGLGAGLLNGLLGIGGGILIVPGLIFLRGFPPRVAVSTSLGTVLLLSSVAFAVHVTLSGLYFSLGASALLLAAGSAGSQAGAFLLRRIPQHWVLYIFATFATVSSLHLIAQGLGWEAVAPGGPRMPPLWAFPLVGAVAGFFSGMLGVGGGGIVVLVFASVFQTPILGGLPLALAINIVNSGSGVLAQWRARQIVWPAVAGLVPAALAGIAVGVGLAVVMPAGQLKIVFALFFLYMATRLFRRGRRSRPM